MSRVHDMGGRFGDGAVKPEPESVKFHADWHPDALAVTIACGALGLWNLDASRHAREGLPAADYARFTYYEKWIAALTNLLVNTGAITRQELLRGEAEQLRRASDRCLKAPAVAGVLAAGGPATRPSDVAAWFKAGDCVLVRSLSENMLVDGGHTRLPAYAAGAQGIVVRYHGTHVFPDSNAHGLGEAPEPLYAVALKASDIWAHPEHPSDEVVLDLWQSYLTAA